MLPEIPEFVNIYEQSDAEITGLTAFIINASKFISENGLYPSLELKDTRSEMRIA